MRRQQREATNQRLVCWFTSMQQTCRMTLPFARPTWSKLFLQQYSMMTQGGSRHAPRYWQTAGSQACKAGVQGRERGQRWAGWQGGRAGVGR